MHSSLVIGSGTSMAFLLMGSIFMLGGCGPAGTETDGELDLGDEEAEEDIASTEQALYSGWTAYVSEEYAPIGCDSGSLMSAVQCTGAYCDNTRAYCQPTNSVLGGSYWTSYFSEESTNYRVCAGGYFVTGMACKGAYCDNLSLQCSYVSNHSATNCYWTGWVSEEGGGTLSFGNGYYIQGAQCSGAYCDNKRFYVCQLG